VVVGYYAIFFEAGLLKRVVQFSVKLAVPAQIAHDFFLAQARGIQCVDGGRNHHLVLYQDSPHLSLLRRLSRVLVQLLLSALLAFQAFLLPLLLLLCDQGLRMERALHQLVVKETVVVHCGFY